MKFPFTGFLVMCLVALSGFQIHAEENPNQLLTTLGSTTISGYVDTTAQWTAAAGSVPRGYRRFPVVFVTAPHFVRERNEPITGAPRSFRFTVHRRGGRTNETTVYLNFHSGTTALAQGGVTIPAGASRATSTWLIPDNGIHDGPRSFTATISLDPVRLEMPGAQYRTRSLWPRSAKVILLDPRRSR
ncbi:MAG TPA: hypothetical protein VK846_04655 [Candidatus Limnocylindria bacterium]|nr:hypothetical protein [Candidatus Limnocylindria bacterium]